MDKDIMLRILDAARYITCNNAEDAKESLRDAIDLIDARYNNVVL